MRRPASRVAGLAVCFLQLVAGAAAFLSPPSALLAGRPLQSSACRVQVVHKPSARRARTYSPLCSPAIDEHG